MSKEFFMIRRFKAKLKNFLLKTNYQALGGQFKAQKSLIQSLKRDLAEQQKTLNSVSDSLKDVQEQLGARLDGTQIALSKLSGQFREDILAERQATHWIVRNEIQKSRHNIGFAQMELSRSETMDYIQAHMSSAKQFDDKYRLREFLVEQLDDSLRLVAEFGVYKGESISHFAQLTSPVIVHGFDSFDGLPEDWRPGFDAGHFAVEVPSNLPSNVILHKGWFDETLPDFLMQHGEPIALLHVDSDLYSSAKTILHHLGVYLRAGTVILFDDYFNYPGWKVGEHLAFQEFVEKHSVEYEYLAFNSSMFQVALRIISIREVST